MKIGLALSGGGFRASLFHLGVIRRLEELGIMQDVAVVSSVSGGSIIAAYYLVQMENRLRNVPEFEHLSSTEQACKRVEIFEGIAEDFVAQLDHNLRSRAIIFTPFFHPLLFVKTLFMKAFRGRARAELIQKEYDDRFYHGDTLDQLPSVVRHGERSAGGSLAGPKLVLNATSLLSGERKSFSREPNTTTKHLETPDNNFLRLSQVVGASSGVPVLFPPTWVRGDLLVDGGVADNQGIEGLEENDNQGIEGLEQKKKEKHCDVLIVSDASGQMEALDNMGTGEATVYARVNDIFQFQIRKKLLDALEAKRKAGTEVSFIHLYMNLKDLEVEKNLKVPVEERKAIPRVSSSLIPALARIRTDLDQFDPVERESLMYHGYTLIDADLRKYCEKLIAQYGTNEAMRVAPLFATALGNKGLKKIRLDLEAGALGIFLQRSLKKYPKRTGLLYGLGALLWLASAFGLLVLKSPYEYVRDQVFKVLEALVPLLLRPRPHAPELLRVLPFFDDLVTGVNSLLVGLSVLAALLVIFALPLYLAIFAVFVVTRSIVRSADNRAYKKIVGEWPTLEWRQPEKEHAESSDKEPAQADAAKA